MAFVQAVRTALFYFIFIGQTVVIAFTVGCIALVSGRTRVSWAMAVFWCRSNLAYLRVLTGVKTKVSGAGYSPPRLYRQEGADAHSLLRLGRAFARLYRG